MLANEPIFGIKLLTEDLKFPFEISFFGYAILNVKPMSNSLSENSWPSDK